jgi:hypothetical protein
LTAGQMRGGCSDKHCNSHALEVWGTGLGAVVPQKEEKKRKNAYDGYGLHDRIGCLTSNDEQPTSNPRVGFGSPYRVNMRIADRSL